MYMYFLINYGSYTVGFMYMYFTKQVSTDNIDQTTQTKFSNKRLSN